MGIPSGRHCECKGLEAGKPVAWLEVSREKSLTREQLFFSATPHLSSLLFPPLQSDSYQEDIYPMTPGTEPALTPDEWLGGINRGRYKEWASQKRLRVYELCLQSGSLHFLCISSHWNFRSHSGNCQVWCKRKWIT